MLQALYLFVLHVFFLPNAVMSTALQPSSCASSRWWENCREVSRANNNWICSGHVQGLFYLLGLMFSQVPHEVISKILISSKVWNWLLSIDCLMSSGSAWTLTQSILLKFLTMQACPLHAWAVGNFVGAVWTRTWMRYCQAPWEGYQIISRVSASAELKLESWLGSSSPVVWQLLWSYSLSPEGAPSHLRQQIWVECITAERFYWQVQQDSCLGNICKTFWGS